MSALYIVRGLPGSGKSTYARKLATKIGCEVYEADMWFLTEDGTYDFDPKELPNAHKWCQNSAMRDMYDNKDVIVSNTFTTLREMTPYIETALSLKMQIVVNECTGDYGNIHNVPRETIDRMKLRWFPTEELKMHFHGIETCIL